MKPKAEASTQETGRRTLPIATATAAVARSAERGEKRDRHRIGMDWIGFGSGSDWIGIHGQPRQKT